MGDLGEPTERYEDVPLSQLPPFLKPSVDRWKADTAGPNDDWGTNPIDSAVGFAHAVDWTEPWIIGILAMHCVLLILACATRQSFEAQSVLFMLTLALCASAEWLNALGAAHWKEFASQDYFDEHGVFASAVFSAPLLLVAFTIMIFSLKSTVGMMVIAKRQQLQLEMKEKARREKGGAADGASGGGERSGNGGGAEGGDEAAPSGKGGGGAAQGSAVRRRKPP